MKRLPMLSTVAGVACLATSALYAASEATMKLTESQCNKLWTTANAGGSDHLDQAAAAKYVTEFGKADTDGNNKLSSKEWMSACEKGLVKTATKVDAPTSDRTPEGATERTPGATGTGAAGTDAGQTPGGTSDRTP